MMKQITNILLCNLVLIFFIFSSMFHKNIAIDYPTLKRFTQLDKLFTQTEKSVCSCFIFHADLSSNPSMPQESLDSLTSGMCHPAGVVRINLQNASDLSSLRPFEKLIVVGKYRPTCSIGFIYMLKSSSLKHLPIWFAFLQTIHGIIKTEQHKFVFISNIKSSSSAMLTSQSFGGRFRLPLSITLNHQTRSASVLHFHPNDGKLQESSVFQQNLFTDKTKNLNMKALTVSTPTSTTWLNEMHTVNNEWIPKRGIYAIVLDQLSIKYNFTTRFIPSTGGGTGAKVNKTIWIGTVGDVLYRKADIGHVTAITFKRSVTVDYTFPISYEWLTFTTGKAPEHHTWKTIYWPFTSFVWQLTALVSLITGVLLKIVLRVTGQSSLIEKIVEYMLAVVTEEGVKAPEQLPTISLRFTMLLWLLFSLVMGTAYKSKLTAFLALPHTENLPDSFADLAGSAYSIGLQYIKGAAYQILKSSKNPTYISIFQRMELEESDVKCFKRTIKNKFACISWDSIADYVYHKNLTDKYRHAPVVKSPASTCFLTAGIVMEKGSFLKISFDHLLIWAVDTGMMIKWRELDYDYVVTQRKQWEKETNQPEVDYNPPENAALSFSHLSGGYYFFFSGILLSIIAFLAEKFYFKCRNSFGCKDVCVAIINENDHNLIGVKWDFDEDYYKENKVAPNHFLKCF